MFPAKKLDSIAINDSIRRNLVNLVSILHHRLLYSVDLVPCYLHFCTIDSSMKMKLHRVVYICVNMERGNSKRRSHCAAIILIASIITEHRSVNI